MSTTIEVIPTGVAARQTSGKWTDAYKLYDRNINTAPGSQSGWIALKLDLSEIPAGAEIQIVTVYYQIERKSTLNPVRLYASYSQTYNNSESDLVHAFDMPAGNYGVNETHISTWYPTPEEQVKAVWLGTRPYAYLTLIDPNLSKAYEVLAYITFDEPTSKIYVGEKKAKEVYVGDKKASAVYIGNTKIL